MAHGSVELGEQATLGVFLKRADKALGFAPPGYFRQALAQRTEPTVLINGNRVELPEGLLHPLREGDVVTVVAPVAGG